MQTITTNVSTPSDVRVDASGNIYVLDKGSNRITKYTSAGVYSGIFASGFSGPYAMAIAPTGIVYVADSGNNLVDIYNSSGTLLNTISVTDPKGIAVDAAGDIFVSSYSGNKIYEYPPLGGYVLTGTLPAGLSFNTTTGVISGTPTASSAASNYTITGYNALGNSSTVISIAVGTSVAWTGRRNTKWATAGNWSTGSVPGVNDAVNIGVSAYIDPFEPAITTANVTVGSITFGNNGGSHTLTVTSPRTLTIGGYLSVPAAVTPTLTGTGAVNIAPGASVNITGTGVLTITSPLAFTLKSNATGSGSIGQILATSIAGTGADSIRVERYITGGAGYRGYRLMSSPVYAAAVSPNNVYSINYLRDNVFLTGTSGTTNGFDQAGNPTLYLFREDQTPSNGTFTSGNFWGISNMTPNSHANDSYSVTGGTPTVTSSFNIPVGNGVMFFFRGNRASASLLTETQASYITPVTVTTITSGTLNQGQVIVHNWYTPASANLGWTITTSGLLNNSAVRGFNLVGNPYASSIDWEQYNTTTTTSGIYANNVGNTIYELNPATNNYDTYQVGGASTNHGSRTIVSGEGFYVIAANNSSPQLIFNESAKTTTQNTGLNLFMATRADITSINNSNPDQHLRIQLAADSIHTDDVYIGFDAAAGAQYNFKEDAPYKAGTGEVNLSSISSDNVALAINKLPLPKLNQTAIPLHVGASAYGDYKLNMLELKGIPAIYQVWLMDRYKNDSLDMRHNATYAFDFNTDTNSYGSKRFQLVIRQNPALAMQLLNFTANKATEGAQIAWKTENEENYTNFTVERSSNGGKTYDVLDGFASGDLGTYSYLDKAPPVAADMYRLKIEDLNGTISYSKIVTLMYANGKSLVNDNISIYPNPAKSTLNLSINPAFNSNLVLRTTSGPKSTINNTVYNIKIVSNTGSVLQTATTTQQNWQTDISKLLPGTYVIQVVNNDSIVGKGTFIKL